MKKIFFLLAAAFLFSCNSKKGSGQFTIDGELKNAPDQQVFLEQLYFNQDPPHVVDTGALKNGRFSLSASAPDEGLYRIRFAQNAGYLVINDENEIGFEANANDSTLHTAKINTPANKSLTNLIIRLDSIHTKLLSEDQQRKMYMQGGNDSLAREADKNFNETNLSYQDYLLSYIDSSKSPIVSIFALSYAQDINMDTVKNKVAALSKKHPGNSSVAEVVKQFDQMALQQEQAPPQGGSIKVGEMAPDFTLPDADGKPFSLSSMKGKYVLIDFWASWCGPCRQENPNIVEAYHRFKNRNFEILGVSLDREKDAWLKAVKDDKLDWKQVSDLKFWNSEAAALYNVQAIPYNVLIDPQGKVIATELRGPDLSNALLKAMK